MLRDTHYSEETTDNETDTHHFHGIYPDCLTIKMEQHSFETVTHQDVRVVRFNMAPEGAEPIYGYKTQLCDKNLGAQFDKIRPCIIHLCDADTMLPESCIYGVVYSQSRRFAARNTMLDDFRNNVIHMIGGMASMGYVKRKIDSQFSKFANRFSSRYGKHSLKLIETEVKRVLQTAQAATTEP